MMNGQFATSAMNQINGMAPRISQATVSQGQPESEPARSVSSLVRPVWIALLSLMFATGVGLGTTELLTYLFAESWNAAGLYGV
jgi:hypothetical protein